MSGSPPGRRAATRPAAWAGLAAASLLLAACAGTVAPPATAPGAAAAPVWSLPAGELATQRLLRVSYDGPEGEGSFRLTLRLLTAERYRAEASDPLGRPLWTLDVTGGAGLWLDHRERLACRLRGRFDLAAARLAPFPLTSLPALLLGRVPAVPATPVQRRAADDGAVELAYRDASGRRWTVRLEGSGAPRSWTLWRAGEPAVWWRRSLAAEGAGGAATLSDRRRGTQLRWRQVVREPLAGGDLATAAVPEGYETVDCGRAYGTAAGGGRR